jgi:hypothetical protein
MRVVEIQNNRGPHAHEGSGRMRAVNPESALPDETKEKTGHGKDREHQK